MLEQLAWLALEVKSLDPARTFYEETLDMRVLGTGSDTVSLAAGDTALVLRRPSGLPRGGLHTHFAFSIPADEYDDWWERLETEHGLSLDEHRFGDARALYCYDPDGNCVELGGMEVPGSGIDGIFEVVLEVSNLERAEAFYRDLEFETVDRGEDRRRVRMEGPMALELWEPQLGIADARGGVHVDLGFRARDPERALSAVEDRVCSVRARESDRISFRDADGHHVTVVSRNV